MLRSERVGRARFAELYRRSNGGSSPRLGLAVSRKSAPLAVARNLFKRIARESARAHARTGLLTGYDWVVRAQPGFGRHWSDAKRTKHITPFKRALRNELDALWTAHRPTS